jgi:hypothetical protein
MHFFIKFIIFIAILFAQFFSVYADIKVVSPLPPAGVNGVNLPEVNNITGNREGSWRLIGAIISWFIGITAVLAIMSITWAAIQMVLAVGEDEKIKKARYTMIYSFIWLIVAWLAYGAVNFVVKLDLNSFL